MFLARFSHICFKRCWLLLLYLFIGSSCLTASSLELEKYHLLQNPITIPNITKNASGLTYDKTSNSLYVIINKPAQIIQLSTKGNFIRKIILEGFSDTEGIEFISKNTFAIVEEGNAMVRLVTINQNTKKICINEALKSFKVDNPKDMISYKKKKKEKQTNGIEALGYNALTKTIWVAKEKKPQKIYYIEINKKQQPYPAQQPWPVEYIGLGDISGLTILSKLEHILLLSDKSSRIVETTIDGKIISSFPLIVNGRKIKDAEGITIDNQGNLYVCSEPNQLYIFNKH